MASVASAALIQTEHRRTQWLALAEVAAGYGLLECALWSHGLGQVGWGIATGIVVIGLTLKSHRTGRELGITGWGLRKSLWLIPVALWFAGLALFVAGLADTLHGTHDSHPVARAMLYAVWSLVQQFLVQSFIFVRLEALGGRRRAVVGTAILFSLAHLPSPLLVPATFVAGLVFSRAFARYRNIYALGVAHAILGLALAVSVPESITHQMRVGVGYGRTVSHFNKQQAISDKQ
jgi:membrane protease YdiL (CAAX protease family)